MSYPAWSPDGRWLAVEIKRGDQTHVGVVSRDGGAAEQLTFEDGQSWPHSWSPDGERIAFAAERGGVWNVWAVSRRTRQGHPADAFQVAERLRPLPGVVAARRPDRVRAQHPREQRLDGPAGLVGARLAVG